MYRENVKSDQALKHSGAIKHEKEPFHWDEFRRLCELERASRAVHSGYRTGEQLDSAHADGKASQVS
jgi:hypothetical protein